MSALKQVFKYAREYAAEQFTDTEAIMKKHIETAEAENAALREDLAKVIWDAYINEASLTKSEADEIASHHWKTWQEVAAALK